MFKTFFGGSLFILKMCPYHRILLFVNLPSMVFIFKFSSFCRCSSCSSMSEEYLNGPACVCPVVAFF
jgi:hypothetical protein